MAEKKSAEQITAETKIKYDALIRALQTDDFKKGLEILEIKFGGETYVPKDDSATFVRIGEQRVLTYLKELVKEAHHG